MWLWERISTLLLAPRTDDWVFLTDIQPSMANPDGAAEFTVTLVSQRLFARWQILRGR